MSKIPHLASEISHVAGLDSAHTRTAEAHEHAPIDVHESHDWIGFPNEESVRWMECSACAIRDYYPGAATACGALGAPPGKGRVEAPSTLAEACDRLRRDLDEFAAWWRGRGLGDLLPSGNEWRAEFLEWSKSRK
jgi:hypothetical protein